MIVFVSNQIIFNFLLVFQKCFFELVYNFFPFPSVVTKFIKLDSWKVYKHNPLTIVESNHWYSRGYVEVTSQ